ncbi:hypothetical protein LJC68_07350 [Bacteroidales bacterium OttesenSCG-928-B11]|nr:hypothetical protein [Bacteroidales bacterium OttesenSCG-928-B11]
MMEETYNIVGNSYHWITAVSALLNFLLGGTTIWGIIKWLGEKKLRVLEMREKETSLESQRFRALTEQIEYQKQLITEFIQNEQQRDELDDKQRELIKTIKRNSHKIESDKIELERQLAISKAYECKREDCQQRMQ